MEFGNGPGKDNVEFARVADINDLTFLLFGESHEHGRVIATDMLQNDQWQFIASTVDASGHVTLYKDGDRIKEKLTVPSDK